LTSRRAARDEANYPARPVTAVATTATQTLVCRLSDMSSAAWYSPATWTRPVLHARRQFDEERQGEQRRQ